MANAVEFDDRRVSYEASAGQAVFDIDFPMSGLSAADLIVSKNGVVLGQGAYSVDTTVLTVTLGTGAADGDIITIDGATQLIIETLFPRSGDLKSSVLNNVLRRILFILQEQERNLGRTVLFNPSQSGAFSSVLPFLNAGDLIGVNADGDGLAVYRFSDFGDDLDVITSDPTIGDLLTYDGVRWVNSVFLGKRGEGIASSGPIDLGAADSDYVYITGTGTVTSFGSSQNRHHVWVEAAGAFTLQHSGNIELPGAANIVCAVGDKFEAIRTAGNAWKVFNFQRASGQPLRVVDVASGGTGATTAEGARANLGINDVVPINYLSGYTLSNNATDAEHDIDISIGQASALNGVDAITLSASLTKRLDASWAPGTDEGGLSSGLVLSNNTWYHVFAIVVGGSVDVGFDTSPVAANLIVAHGVTAFRRIGSVLTDGSANIVPFIQSGDTFLYKTPVSDHNVTNPGTASRLVSLSVPIGIKVRPVAWVSIITSSGTVCYGLATSVEQNDTVPANTNFNYFGRGASGVAVGVDAANLSNIETDAMQQVRLRISNSSASVSEQVTTMGWVDARERH